VAAPGGKDRGDQYVVLRIVPPPRVSARGAELLKEFEAAERFNPRADVPWK
jgi:DnaJ-class molecular chaperone